MTPISGENEIETTEVATNDDPVATIVEAETVVDTTDAEDAATEAALDSNPEGELLTLSIPDAAGLLGVTVRSIQRQIVSGRLHTVEVNGKRHVKVSRPVASSRDLSYGYGTTGGDLVASGRGAVASIMAEQEHHLQRVEQDLQAIKAYIAGDLGALLRDRLSGIPTAEEIALAVTAQLATIRDDTVADAVNAAVAAANEAAAANMQRELGGIKAQLDELRRAATQPPALPAPAADAITRDDLAPLVAELQSLKAGQEAKDGRIAELEARLLQTSEQRAAAEERAAAEKRAADRALASRQVGEGSRQPASAAVSGPQPPPQAIQKPWWMFWGD